MADSLDLLLEADKIFVAGNGGSAANTDHFACDLLRSGRWALSLCANVATLTMIANDYGYEQVFSYQLKALARGGELLVLLTASGRSRNLIAAAQLAGLLGVKVLLLTGNHNGLLPNLADAVELIPGVTAGEIETQQAAVLHTWAQQLKVGVKG